MHPEILNSQTYKFMLTYDGNQSRGLFPFLSTEEMMKTKNFQSIMSLLIFFLFYNHAWAAGWILLGKSELGKIYYDQSGIERINKNTLRVWTKTVLNEDGKKKYFSLLQSINEAPDRPDIMNYELMLNEIDCLNARGRFSSMTINYDKDAVVYRGPKSFSQWMTIDSPSTMGMLKNKVCRAGMPSKKKNK